MFSQSYLDNATDEELLERNLKVTGFSTLHSYTLKMWGCATDASDVNVSQTDANSLAYEFKTRSSPPIAWLKEISTQYPELMFELESNNEFELWDEFDVVYINGSQVVMQYTKNQK